MDSSDCSDQHLESTDAKDNPFEAGEVPYETNQSTPVLTPSSFLHSNTTSAMSPLEPALSPLFPLNKFAPDQLEQLVLVLESLDASNRAQLVELDPQRGTTPLHYAAQHGVDYVVKVLIKYFGKWGLYNRNWYDSNGKTPVEIAIYENRLSTVKVFLKEMPSGSFAGANGWHLLKAAVETNSVSMLEMLLDQGMDVNLTSELKESCIYMACKTQFIDGVEFLLKRNADINIAEISNGWTPLFIACVIGNEEIVRMLLEAKSSVCMLDRLGWTAMEHAGFRGFLKIAEMAKPDIVPADNLTLNGPRRSSESLSLSTQELSIYSQSQSSSLSSSATVFSYLNEKFSASSVLSDEDEPEDHNKRYLLDNSMVLVNLGSMDIRDKRPPVELNVDNPAEFDLTISSPVCDGTYSFCLPIRLSTNDDPFLKRESMDQVSFYIKSPEDVTIFFDIVTKHERVSVGRAVAFLSEHIRKTSFDNTRSLYRAITIPILNLTTYGVLGKVTFEYLVVNPFNHPKLGTVNSHTYWDKLMSSQVIGHRGLGRNSDTMNLQLGENTLESFEQAAVLGASYVEFDVQLTKDFVPVIYHDYLVSETGLDIQTHNLTLEQFLGISDQHHHSSTTRNRARSPPVRRYRKENGYDSIYDDISNMSHRIRNTRDWKVKKFKPNIRGHHIQAPVITLEHAFKTVSKDIGFNIECKYPMIDECENEDMDCVGAEFNYWTDQLLKCIFDHANGRDVILSTFHPEVCIMLALKQDTFPVMFLTEAGNSPLVDVRAKSLQEAIKFARRWNLVGVIPEAVALNHCPRLANVVKDCGLKCITYGSLDNDVEVVKILVKNGVDAVVADAVLPVKQCLDSLKS